MIVEPGDFEFMPKYLALFYEVLHLFGFPFFSSFLPFDSVSSEFLSCFFLHSSNCSIVPKTHIAANAAAYMYGFSLIFSVGEIPLHVKSIVIPAKITPDPNTAHVIAHVGRLRYIVANRAVIAAKTMIAQ